MMDYHFIVLPLVASLLTQVLKFIIKANKLKFSLKNLIAYSGMPSGHSTMTVSLATIIGLELGFKSPIFAISAFFTILTLRDAIGLRQYLGKHGEIINDLVEDLEDDKVLDRKYPELLEKIGHNFLQVLVGAIIGFTVSYIGWLYL